MGPELRLGLSALPPCPLRVGPVVAHEMPSWVHGDYSMERVKARRAALDRAAAELWDEWAVPGIAKGFVAVPVRYRNVAGVQLLGTAVSRQDPGVACMVESVKRRFHPLRARKADSGNG